MQFHDKRHDPTESVPPSLERLRAAIVARSQRDEHYENKHIIIADHDPKIGPVLHLQMNWEPAWIDEAFKTEWYRLYAHTLHSQLLENAEWRRYAWGVWEK